MHSPDGYTHGGPQPAEGVRRADDRARGDPGRGTDRPLATRDEPRLVAPQRPFRRRAVRARHDRHGAARASAGNRATRDRGHRAYRGGAAPRHQWGGSVLLAMEW